MRIAVSGTTNIGKTTFVNDFLQIWSTYKTPEKTYRSVLIEGTNYKVGETTQKTQGKILTQMVKQQNEYRKTDKIIYDGCPLDNIAYTLWCYEKNKVDDKFVEKSLKKVYESMRKLDIILFIPLTKASPVEYNGTDDEYVFMTEMDHIYKGLFNQWMNNPESTVFPKEDKPGMVDIYGNQQERIALTRMYLNDAGDAIDATPTLEQLSEIDEMQELIDQQKELQRNKL
jgi:hypothetical protein